MPDVTVQVFHNISRDASFGLNTIFEPTGDVREPYRKTQAVRPGERHPLVLVFEYPAEDLGGEPTDGFILDHAWEAFNVGETGIAGPYRARRLRSLSKGDVIRVGNRAWSAEGMGWARRDDAELNIIPDGHFDPVAFFGLADGGAPTHTVPWDPQATGFCHWCKEIRPILEVEPFNLAGNLACQDVRACARRQHAADGGGFCAYCHAPVYTEENAKIVDCEGDDYCQADPGSHFHSLPVSFDALAGA